MLEWALKSFVTLYETQLLHKQTSIAIIVEILSLCALIMDKIPVPIAELIYILLIWLSCRAVSSGRIETQSYRKVTS